MANYLLELGCEEIPARFAPNLLNDLALLIFKRLEELGFCHHKTTLKTFGTYRRLAIFIENLLEKQVSKEEQVLGPPLNVAKQDGAWSPAALGFAKKFNVKVEDLTTSKDAKGREVLCVVKTNKARVLDKVLAQEIPEIITKMHLPIAMYWADHKGPFFRPLHWVVSLLDDKVIPFDLFSVKSGSTSYGHRFLSLSKTSMGKAFQLKEANMYVQELKKYFVLVDIDERKKTIEEMLTTYGASKESFLDLLEEVNWLCEYPKAIQGDFDTEFLNLPELLLVSSMSKHQKYFSLYQKVGKKESLKPSFLMISDNLNDTNYDSIKQGNEAVLRARFNDVDFFWKQDTLKPLAEYVPKLKDVVFQKGAGTLFDHMQRMQKIARYVVGLWGYESYLEDILRAIYLSKADLVTQMVSELPTMQGFVGSQYAILSKEKDCVCEAIKTHYLPVGESSNLPQSIESKLVALVDKLDLIVSSYHVGYRPTSSKDPLGLRRAMLGVLRLLLDLKKPCLVNDLFVKAASFLDLKPKGLKELSSFFQKRVTVYFVDKGFRKDIVTANQSIFLGDLVKAQSSLVLLQEASQNEPECFKRVAQAAIRVSNLMKVLDQKPIALSKIDITLEPEQKLKDLLNCFLDKPFKFSEAYQLAVCLESFFEQVMVMDKNPEIKFKRLSLLFYAKGCFEQLGSFEGIEC